MASLERPIHSLSSGRNNLRCIGVPVVFLLIGTLAAGPLQVRLLASENLR